MIHFCKPKKSSFFSNNKGFSIIEAIVGITLAALLLVAFTALISQTIKINHANKSGLKATMYLQELIEIAKDLEQSNWIELSTTTCASGCSANIDANEWKLTNPGDQNLENFTRNIFVNQVCRLSGEIVDCSVGGAEVSTNTKKVIATIKWNDGVNSSILETYVYTY